MKVFLRPSPAGSFQDFLKYPAGGYDYAARIPAGRLREGPYEFVVTVFNGDSIQTFPSGARTKPGAWNYAGTAAWKFDVVNARSTLRLFDPGSDAGRLTFTRIGDAGRRGLFRVALAPATGQPVFHLELPVDTSGWSPPDYTASLVIKLPEGFPGEWNYWVGPADGRGGAADRPRLEHLERLQLSLRHEDGVAAKSGSYGVEVEWIALGF